MSAMRDLAVRLLISARDQASTVITGVVTTASKAFAALAALVGSLSALFSAGVYADAVTESKDLESQLLKLEATIKATGGAAGYSVAQIDELARSMGDAAEVRDAASQLLTFKTIAGETFERTLKLAKDLAAAGFGTLESATIQLGKALENPAQGISALTEVGVTFTEGQKAMIASLMLTGKQAQAQGLILDAVAGQVGGVAEAMDQGLEGALGNVTDTFIELKQQLGAAVVPVLTEFFNKITDLYGRLKDSGAVTAFGAAIAEAFGQALTWVEKLDFSTALEQVKRFADGAREQISKFSEAMNSLASGTKTTLAVVGLAWDAGAAVIHLAAGVIAKAMALPEQGFSVLVTAASKVGAVSEETAAAVRNSVESIKSSSETNFEQARASAAALIDGLKGLATEAPKAADATHAIASAAEAAAEKSAVLAAAEADMLGHLRAYLQAQQDAALGSQVAADSLGQLKESFESARDKVEKLAAAEKALAADQEALAVAREKAALAVIAYQEAQSSAAAGSVKAALELKSLEEQVKGSQAAVEALTDKVAKSREAIERIAGAAPAANEQLARLRKEYSAFISAGDAQGAAGKLQEIARLEAALGSAGKQAGVTKEQVATAFKTLGLESQADLKLLEARAKEAFETIKASGVAAPADVQNAFAKYAESAIAANNGVATAALKTEAAMQGVAIQATASGDQVVKSANRQAEALRTLAERRAYELQQAEEGTQILGKEMDLRLQHLTNLQATATARNEEAEATRLGNEVSQQELYNLQALLAARKDELTAAQAALAAKQAQANLDGIVEQSELNEIANVRAVVTAKQQEIAAVEEAVRAKEDEIETNKRAQEAADKRKAAEKDWFGQLASVTRSWSETMQAAGVELSALGDYADVAEAKFRAVYESLLSVDGALTSADFAGYAAKLADIGEKAAAAATHAAAQARALDAVADALDTLQSAYDQQDIGLSDYIARLEALRRQYAGLSDEQVPDLVSALADAKTEMADFTESARSGLIDLQREWADLNDQKLLELDLEQQAQRAEIQLQLLQARKDKNAEAVSLLEQQLALLEQIYQKRRADEAASEAADKVKAAEDAATEAARRAGLTDEARQSEDLLAELQQQLEAAILANDAALQQSILDQIAAEKKRHQAYLDNLDAEAKAKEKTSATTTATETTSAATNTAARTAAASSTTSASGAATTTKATTVNINIAGVLDVNDRTTLETLARKLKPIFADLERRGA